MKFKISLIFLCFLCSVTGYTQKLGDLLYSISTDSLFTIVAESQSSGTAYFDEGIFPSYRKHSMSNKLWKDDNVFYSQIIVFTLSPFQDLYNPLQRKYFQNIRRKVLANYYKYKNSRGGLTYNFWKTNPSKHFPNSSFFSKHKKFKLPDDMDVTSMIYLTLDTVSKDTLDQLKSKMAQHANLVKKRIKNVFKRYRNYKAYSTWFGNKMPIEFDISVMANVLYLTYKYDLKLNDYDQETLRLLAAVIKSKDHLKYSEYLSPYYRTNAIVLYHLCRFIADCEPAVLIPFIPQLVEEVKYELKKTNSFMEKVILSSSLLRFGIQPPASYLNKKMVYDQDYFPFYYAPIGTSIGDPFKRWFAKARFSNIDFICPAYNNVLLLEHKMLFQRFLQQHPN